MSTVHDEFPGATPRLCVNSVEIAVSFYSRVWSG